MHQLLKFRFLIQFSRSYSTQNVVLGEEATIGNILKLPKSQIQEFETCLPVDYAKFLDQCREAHLFYSKEIHKLLQQISQESDRHKRIVLTGEIGSGKSMALLAALLFSRQKGMLLIHFPSLFSISNSNHPLEPYQDDDGTFYEQDTDVINWMKYFADLNPNILNAETTDACEYNPEHLRSFNVKPGETIGDAMERSRDTTSYPSKVMGYLIEQILKVPSRPPVMIAMDGINALFSRSGQRLDEHSKFLETRKLTVLRTVYDLVFSDKFAALLTGRDVILAGLTKRGAKGVKAIRRENKELTERENSGSFSEIFRPQALREEPILCLKELDTSKYARGKSYEMVGLEGELRKMDVKAEFQLGEGETNVKIGIEKLHSQSKEREVTLEVRDGRLAIDYKHLDDVTKEKISNSNYPWKPGMLLGKEGMNAVFGEVRPFTEIEMQKWQKDEVSIAVGEATKDLWGREEVEESVVEEIYPMSSFGNPRLVYNLCRMVFEH